MVKLRLQPMGRKKRPFFRIIATEVSKPLRSRTLDLVGSYDPMNAELKIDADAAISWIKRGAQMTPTVSKLLRSQGILAHMQGLEGRVREDALTRNKPKRRKKLLAAEAAIKSATAEDGENPSAVENGTAEAPTASE